MSNYINPFEKRTFSERFMAVFAFMKRNFVLVMKYALPVFAVISALLGWYTVANPSSTLNNVGGLLIFVAFAYFKHYIANCGDMSTVSFKEMLDSMGSAFCNVFVASVIPLVLVLGIVAVYVVFLFLLIAIVGQDNRDLIILACVPLGVFVLYIIPIMSIYYVHFYFSHNSSDSIKALKESFQLVKGHWWSTLGFIMSFELLQLVVLLPIILVLQKSNFICEWIGNLLIFVVTFFSMHTVVLYQYGHLKTLQEECGTKDVEFAAREV